MVRAEKQRVAHAHLDAIREAMNVLHEKTAIAKCRVNSNEFTWATVGDLAHLREQLEQAVSMIAAASERIRS